MEWQTLRTVNCRKLYGKDEKAGGRRQKPQNWNWKQRNYTESRIRAGQMTRKANEITESHRLMARQDDKKFADDKKLRQMAKKRECQAAKEEGR